MEAPFQAQNRSSRSEKLPYIQASPVSGPVSQWTSLETVPKYTQITKLLGINALNRAKFTTRQRVTVINSYISVVLKLKGTNYLHS